MKFIKNAFGTLIGVAVGSTAMKAVEGSAMSQGFKDLTNTGISLGIVGHSMKSLKFKGGKNSLL